MPLYGKQPFERKTLKGVERHDQELFYCGTTHEAFASYEELFERVILCKSLVWSCALTGRGALTFQEALESEGRARKALRGIPWHLKRLLLSLVDKCKAQKLNELCTQIFDLVQNRFVIGETVEAVIDKAKKTCEVIEVLQPGSNNKSKSPLKKFSESPKKVSPSKLRYEVCEKDSEIQILHVVGPDNMSRSKGSLSKDKTKLFLKHCVESDDGVLKVKNDISRKYHLNAVTPALTPSKRVKPERSPKKVSPIKNGATVSRNNSPGKITPAKNALKNCQSPSRIKKTLKSIDSDIRKMFAKDSAKLASLAKEMNPVVLLEKKTMKANEEAQNLKEKMKIKNLEENKLVSQFMSEWKQKRDDLECDDLKDLPTPTPLNFGIPRELFGDVVAIMEFVYEFASLLNVKSSFSQGLNLELMERALTETDIQGPYSDLMQMFLLAIFKQQDVEEEEPAVFKAPEKQQQQQAAAEDEELETQSGQSSTVKTGSDRDMMIASAVKAANMASSWPMIYHGCLLRQFPLDPFTLSELLRLHLLTSGAEISTVASARGHFQNEDDPGLDFKIKNQTLLRTMGTTSVYLLSLEQRLELLNVLMNQLLTYPKYRNQLKNHYSSLKAARRDLNKLYIQRRKMKKENKEKMLLEAGADVAVVEGVDPEKGEQPKTVAKKINSKEKSEKEIAEDAEFERKEHELQATIKKLQALFRMDALGSDRAHRKFWVFKSVEGLFVEDLNTQVGLCLSKPTPTHLVFNGGRFPQDEVPLSTMRKFLKGINNNSDKENKLTVAKPKNKGMVHLNGANVSPSSPSKSGKGPVFGMCTADPRHCPVHGVDRSPVSWSFFASDSDLDVLVNNLNQRGNRESVLKKNLVQGGNPLREWIKKCPTSRLNILEPISEEETVELRKSQRLSNNRSQFTGIHPEEALEVTLRDSILDNEDKIWSGGLGAIKVKDREAWRTAIDNNGYDPQCDDISETNLATSPQPSLLVSSGSDEMETASNSRTPSPVPPVGANVRNLALAIIQVASCVQSKFIGPPLAENQFKKQLEKASAEIEKRKNKEEVEGEVLSERMSWRSVKMPKSRMDHWMESVRNCSSLSQLFLHLITLESSILWQRSALKASCRICRKRGDGENMLLCDKCDRGFHLFCLKPQLEEVPRCEWFCPSCIPAPPQKPRKQKRRMLNYKEVDSEQSDDNEEEEEYDEEEEKRKDVYEEEESSDSDEWRAYKTSKRKRREKKRAAVQKATPRSRCTVCRRGGATLISCNHCSKSLHLTCVQPALRKVPRGGWYCKQCLKNGKDNISASASSPATPISSTTRSSAKRKTDSGTGGRRRRRSSSSDQSNSESLLDVEACQEIVSALNKRSECWPFLKTESKKKGHYNRIVKRPIDLSTIEKNLDNSSYNTNDQFVADIYLMFQNCEVYNSDKSEEYKACKSLTRYFLSLLRKLKLELDSPVLNGELSEKRPKRSF